MLSYAKSNENVRIGTKIIEYFRTPRLIRKKMIHKKIPIIPTLEKVRM